MLEPPGKKSPSKKPLILCETLMLTSFPVHEQAFILRPTPRLQLPLFRTTTTRVGTTVVELRNNKTRTWL